MAGSIKLPHRCPKCGKTARNLDELREKFGFQTMGSSKVVNQSYCKTCR